MSTRPPPIPRQGAGFVAARRSLLVVLLLLGAAAGLALRRDGPSLMPVGCLFNEFTGRHCPGCGMTRASHALLHGDFAAAIAFNPLGVVLLPFLLVALAIELWAWAGRRPPAWRIPLGTRGAVILAATVIGYGVLRNLPWWPFTLLAPG